MKHVKAVIFDWAGTVVDYGSLAPMGAFVETFGQFGVPITIDEARGPMGMAKRPHIAALMALPRVAQAWTDKYGHAPDDADIDAVYDVFVPKNIAVAASYSSVIPGVADVASALRGDDIRIGTTTGYTREIMAEIVPGAAAQGFSPDSIVCTGDTAEGRPSPYMIYRTLPELGVWRAKEAIKVDDTEVGIEEGINGGTWTVGVSVSGNAFGMAEGDVKALAPDEFAWRRNAAIQKLQAAGAHYVIDSVADLMPVVYDIEARLARGERP
ncbi:phosphonoacetaldehyde hydrolase [Paraburkholderia xenovorans LB400]|jgi:phosphonoacetaldehyde hydrolase|uniref:Phosphonoacetaldehyde hydrolase n=1 Tax=Paraburkholderia xenovorans (strain LB400) TaxID=266265 RepID=PHNX_PARXL|nr:phosphonoacetaldehyde hydrolase [Paraburkholderia xenovorans]Q13YI8.1 RecName: Full=Phosphonoacetaldehyde hydrolase; Short=Phosphonatase; AltName: Full=Phosphonoacetaldehyde phosphonohydrolase [Paraburkholderia xenovorans LB400]ABE30851.1 Phosphonoacetaldehyde hydrolase [Paraburkholderia xenovorans LB400]AIP32978.1 phosphonoacetaldehyde hydrolase [Paraburkholderia xenovorans LB400]